jgi:hypothetical protein
LPSQMLLTNSVIMFIAIISCSRKNRNKNYHAGGGLGA